jgi:hypothetical protein
MSQASAPKTTAIKGETTNDGEKKKDVRLSNIIAAKGTISCKKNNTKIKIITAVADAVRTSLGPKGMDKMVTIFTSF